MAAGGKEKLFIIGVGNPRTGTSSMRDALTKLGFKCYHMRCVYQEKQMNHQQKWIDIGAQKLKLKKSKNITSYKQWNEIQIDYNWDEIFKSTKDGKPYYAFTDAPCYAFYQEIMKFYPNHKIILTVRDSNKWYESAMNTIYFASRYYCGHLYFYLFNDYSFKHKKLAINTVWDLMFDDKFENEQYAKNKFNEWNKNVIDYVDKDKLLIFNVKYDSWDKLCKFLDIPQDKIPNEPFPHSNERKILKDMARDQKWKAYGFDALCIGTLVISSIFVYRFYNTK